MSKLLPLWSHIEFSVGRDSNFFSSRKNSRLTTASQPFQDTENRYRSLSELVEDFEISEFHYLQYIQVNLREETRCAIKRTPLPPLNVQSEEEEALRYCMHGLAWRC